MWRSHIFHWDLGWFWQLGGHYLAPLLLAHRPELVTSWAARGFWDVQGQMVLQKQQVLWDPEAFSFKPFLDISRECKSMKEADESLLTQENTPERSLRSLITGCSWHDKSGIFLGIFLGSPGRGWLHLVQAPNWVSRPQSLQQQECVLQVIPTNWYSVWHILTLHLAFYLLPDIYIYIYYIHSDPIWRSIWRIYWHSIWHSLWHSIWHLALVVEVRQCPVRSGARVPAVLTEICSSPVRRSRRRRRRCSSDKI